MSARQFLSFGISIVITGFSSSVGIDIIMLIFRPSRCPLNFTCIFHILSFRFFSSQNRVLGTVRRFHFAPIFHCVSASYRSSFCICLCNGFLTNVSLQSFCNYSFSTYWFVRYILLFLTHIEKDFPITFTNRKF